MEDIIYDYESQIIIVETDETVEDGIELIVEYTFAEWEEMGNTIPPQ